MIPRSPAPLDTPIKPPLSPSLHRYLYFTAACSGAAIMIIEILGAKLLTPYFGSSHFVWTAQIAVTLASLASGYFLGGKFVDRSASLHRIYGVILAAALYLAASLPFIQALCQQCLSMSLPVGSLLAAIALFFVPLALLAMVGPFLVKVFFASEAQIGRAVGKLSALSTLGSLIGTLLIGYVLLPLAPNSVTLFATASLLASLALVYFLAWHRKLTPTALSLCALTTLSGLAGVRIDLITRFEGFQVVARKNSNFGGIHVVETSYGIRYYLNDFLTQNSYNPKSHESDSLFTFMLRELARCYTTNLNRSLCIGMGVGIVPMQLAAQGSKVDVVEINPDIVPIAQQFFGFDPSKLSLHIGDGRQFLNQTSSKYDALVLDAFLGDSSPSHLLTVEAFTSMRRCLTDAGVLVINSFGSFETGKDFFLASLEQTLRKCFTDVRIHASGNGNVFFVASPTRLNPTRTPDFSSMPASVRPDAHRAWESQGATIPSHGLVLTDDFNPVEYHDAKNREEFRRLLASSMRRQ